MVKINNNCTYSVASIFLEVIEESGSLPMGVVETTTTIESKSMLT